MTKTFIASDHHFNHGNILKFTRQDGQRLRIFSDVNHMNEYMVMQHNRVVGADDRVYFLGDLDMRRSGPGLEILARMNGRKVLIKGNHDLRKLKDYLPYFDDIRAVHQLDGVILSHIPIHPDSLSRWKLNVHGHLHSGRVCMPGTKVPDPRYLNVSMECLHDYTPISFDEVLKRVPKTLS